MMKKALSLILHSALCVHHSCLNAPVTVPVSSTSAMSETSPRLRLPTRSRRMAEAALSRFQRLRGLMLWPSVYPAVSAAVGLSKTFTSYLAARSFGCMASAELSFAEALLVLLRQRVAPVAEDFAYAALVWRLQDFEPVAATLRELFLLHFVEDGKVARRPGVLHELQRVVLAQRVAVPVLRQKDSAQVWVAHERDAEEVVGFALHPVGRGPDARDALDSGLARARLQTDALVLGGREEVVDDLELFAVALGPVYAGQIAEVVEGRLRV